MAQVTSKKKRTTRRLYGLAFLIFLSAAAGVGLYRLSPSLLDIGRNFRHAADKILEQSADNKSAEPVLRGTVFDRDLNELAVSYRLYSLYVRPAEITNSGEVVRIVADVTGQDEDHILSRLNEAKSIINVAEHLEQPQVDMIKNARLPGLYIKPVEERFYPEHETAAGLVGFTGKGIGLSGVEGVFDMLLQEGAFRAESVKGIDFSKEMVLGQSKVDIVLTVDLPLQELVERQLSEYLGRSQARGVALLMDPGSGAIRAWASHPAFNPNYYWRVPDSQRKSLFEENIEPELLSSLRSRVAAILKNGESADFPVPETVAAHNYGLTADEIEQAGTIMARGNEGKCTLPSCVPETLDRNAGTDPVRWAGFASSLLNGGWRVSPHVLAAVYDHEKEKVFAWSAEQGGRERILSPALGVMVRHDMVSSFSTTNNSMILVADSVAKTRSREGYSEYILQEVVAAAVPARKPELLLFVVIQHDELYPSEWKKNPRYPSIGDFGKELLASLHGREKDREEPIAVVASGMPRGYDQSNYNQFLISSRIDFQERNGRGTGRVPVMPQLVGLSLRKGLQRLNEYNLQVKVQGSGQIVSQVPGPGEPLQGVGECVLTLASEI